MGRDSVPPCPRPGPRTTSAPRRGRTPVLDMKPRSILKPRSETSRSGTRSLTLRGFGVKGVVTQHHVHVLRYAPFGTCLSRATASESQGGAREGTGCQRDSFESGCSSFSTVSVVVYDSPGVGYDSHVVSGFG